VLTELLDYAALVLPGLALMAACFAIAGGDRDPMLRILILVLGFVLVRDAMTPAGFWRFGTHGNVPWLRFTDDSALLIVFGMSTLAGISAILWLVPTLRAVVRWGTFDPLTVALGVGGGVLAAGPVLLLSASSPIEGRGGGWRRLSTAGSRSVPPPPPRRCFPVCSLRVATRSWHPP
jgi:hypothetical protein